MLERGLSRGEKCFIDGDRISTVLAGVGQSRVDNVEYYSGTQRGGHPNRID